MRNPYNRKGYIRGEPIFWIAELSPKNEDYYDLIATVEVHGAVFSEHAAIYRLVFQNVTNPKQLFQHSIRQMEDRLKAQVRSRMGHKRRVLDD